MKENGMLTVASLISIVLLTLHLADDIMRGMASGQVSNLIGVVILVVWLYGTLLLAERRSGYIVVLLGSLLAAGIPVIHMMGKGVGVGSSIPKSSGGLLFVSTLLALGLTSMFSVVLSVRGLWRLRRGKAQ